MKLEEASFSIGSSVIHDAPTTTTSARDSPIAAVPGDASIEGAPAAKGCTSDRARNAADPDVDPKAAL
jgi:hypothetical protein